MKCILENVSHFNGSSLTDLAKGKQWNQNHKNDENFQSRWTAIFEFNIGEFYSIRIACFTATQI